MMKGLALFVLGALGVLLGGCDLYFGGGDDTVCATTGGGAKAEPAWQLRNPQTGQCEYIGGGYCDNACGPCPAIDLAYPDWGACYGRCEALDEQSCFAAAGCYAAYIDNPVADGRQFWGCWETPPSGPIRGGGCTGLDANSCSRHDDCVSVYASSVNSNDTKFASCEAEPVAFCTSDAGCGADAFCDTSVCYPSPTCTPCDTCGACPDSNTCYGVCVPKDPMACSAITCAPGYHCDQQCTGTTCSPACVADVTCANVDCGPNYTCAELCSTGPNGVLTCGPACVPTQPQLTCEMLATESACISRTDCVPVYDGDNCTCYPDHCECQVLTYARCESL